MAFLLPVVAFLGTSAGAATVAAGSAAIGLYGASENAKAGRKAASAADYSAQIEAAQLEQRAKSTLAAGSYNSDRIKQKASWIMSSQRAQMAAGNNDSNDQSAREIAKKTVQESSLDQLLTMLDAETDAKKDVYQAKVTRQTGKTQANIYRQQARAGAISSVATVLNSAQSSGADWSKLFGT